MARNEIKPAKGSREMSSGADFDIQSRVSDDDGRQKMVVFVCLGGERRGKVSRGGRSGYFPYRSRIKLTLHSSIKVKRRRLLFVTLRE